MLKKNLLSAVLLPALFIAFSSLVVAASFGPGRAQMIPGGGGEIVLDTPTKQVALRFIAEADGPLTSVKFASRLGQTWTEKAPGIFAVALFDDNAGKPGKQIVAASENLATYPGARAREATFRNTPMKAGKAYHIVISVPAASATKQISVNYYLFDSRGGQPLNSFDMETPVTGVDVLTTVNGGSTWSSMGKGAVGAVALTIGGKLQGWSYTGSYDARLINAGDQRQVLMQSFKFTPPGKVPSAKVNRVTFNVRAQGALGAATVPLRVRLLERDGGKELGSTLVPVATGDPSQFAPVDAVFADVTFKQGGAYLLSIDLPEPAGTTAQDYLFIRTLVWGFGEPSLVEVNWQGTDSSLIQSPNDEPASGTAIIKADIPFVIDYTVGR